MKSSLLDLPSENLQEYLEFGANVCKNNYYYRLNSLKIIYCECRDCIQTINKNEVNMLKRNFI